MERWQLPKGKNFSLHFTTCNNDGEFQRIPPDSPFPQINILIFKQNVKDEKFN